LNPSANEPPASAPDFVEVGLSGPNGAFPVSLLTVLLNVDANSCPAATPHFWASLLID
jgi:hypothetical protein